MSKKIKGKEIENKYPAIIGLNKGKPVEVGVEDIFEAINSTNKHMKSEVSRKLNEAEQAAKSILNAADLPLNQCFRAPEQVIEELSRPWFAYRLLEEVEAARVAMKEEDVVGIAFHSMTLMHYISRLTIDSAGYVVVH